AASPHVATRGRILSALYGDREAPDCADKLLNVMVYEIRKRLRDDGGDARSPAGRARGAGCARPALVGRSAPPASRRGILSEDR
ncbi:winged helix-turn-helix domain-containing protein, partial [Methylobacterium sp. WL7]